MVVDVGDSEPKLGELETAEEAKRFMLDSVARNIIIRTTPNFIQCKLLKCVNVREACNLIQEICTGTTNAKENKLEIL